MSIAFIRQVDEALRRVKALEERAAEEGSTFQWAISSASSHLQRVSDTYSEVLERDATEDEAYNPPLSEVK